jgi:hypothetical protein
MEGQGNENKEVSFTNTNRGESEKKIEGYHIKIGGIHLQEPPKQILANILEMFSAHYKFMHEKALHKFLFNSLDLIYNYCQCNEIKTKYKREVNNFLKFNIKLQRMRRGLKEKGAEILLNIIYNIILTSEGVSIYDRSLYIGPSWSIKMPSTVENSIKLIDKPLKKNRRGKLKVIRYKLPVV